MSKIALSGNLSGTGTFTIASPNSNTDRTLNLPDASGTVATTADLAATNVQTFNAGGTWNKPAFGSMARIQVWGGGGGAGRGSAAGNQTGGGGGGYNELVIPLASLGSTETVTIGSGGAGRTGSTGNGTTGGNSSFGTLVTAFGGGGGAGATAALSCGGGGGGQISAGAVGGSQNSTRLLIGRPHYLIAISGVGFDASAGPWHGGTTSFINNPIPGDAVFGGGGGAGGTANFPQGLSVHGGNGGALNNPGTAPGGGGGASSSANGDGASGAAGRVIVTVW